jgi:hypothetical protein
MGITDTAKWRVVYKDETILREIDPDGTEHLFKEINQDKLEYFQLVNPQDIAICQVHLGEDKRLIFARRNIITTGSRVVERGDVKVPLPIKSHQIVIILGWQRTIKGVSSKAIFYLLPDGRIEMDDEWKEDSLHSRVNMPKSNPENKVKPSTDGKILGKGYSNSNDSAFENKK